MLKLGIAWMIVVVACTPARPQPRLFEFHVGFWVSLHQRLYAESSARPPSNALRADATADAAAWNRALAFYRDRYKDRAFLTLIFDDELVRANFQLALADDAPDLASATLPAELRAALEAAAPIYRRLQWPADAADGRALAARLEARAGDLGRSLAPELGAVYDTPWPNTPVRVDIASFAGPVGAYTVAKPDQITLAANDPRHAGDAALEILFHEASHLLVAKLQETIAASCAAQHKQVPRDLWHAILFYSAGELARRHLGPSYEPYADHNGLWRRSSEWTQYRRLIAEHWVRRLDGEETLRGAIDKIVAGLQE